MKLIKYAVAAALAFAFGNAYAFHSGGVAECEGCHSMHNSYEGSANVTGQPQYASGPYLLKARDQSGVCLICHQAADVAPSGYHVSTAGVGAFNSSSPVELTPGGDFAWLKKTMTTTIRGSIGVNEGDRHGHNVVAIDFGFTADKVLQRAPGGTYPASALACSSCHDPHGRYRRFANGSFGTTGLPISSSGSYFTSPEPIAGVTTVGAYRLLAGIEPREDFPALPLFQELLVAGHTDPDLDHCEVTRALVAVRKLTGRFAPNSKFPDTNHPEVSRVLEAAERRFEEAKDRLEPVMVILLGGIVGTIVVALFLPIVEILKPGLGG